jgi:tight adherence protein B
MGIEAGDGQPRAGDAEIALQRLRRDVAALTAEGRMSAFVLALLPPILGLAMYIINPDYMRTLFDTTVGQLLILGGIVLALVGFLWMKKVIKIEV